MDYLPSIFELDRIVPDKFGKLFSLPSQKQEEADPAVPSENNDGVTRKTSHTHKRKISSMSLELNDECLCEVKKKKINHREIERQRRQEMASLYGSLRSTLPAEYLRGKRAISDHIQEAVRYIKDLEENVKELNGRKDKVAKLLNISSSESENLENSKKDCLTVKPCLVGVEVVVDTSLRTRFPLSKALQILIDGGLSVINCTSTKVKGRMLHIIKSEVRDGIYIDVSALEKKLTNSVIRPVK